MLNNNIEDKKEVDELDLKILKYLKKDSRRSGASISEEVGVSARTITDRINRLVDRGVIKRFTVQIDLGFNLRSIIIVQMKKIFISKDQLQYNIKKLISDLEEKQYIKMIAINNNQDLVYIVLLAHNKEEVESLLIYLHSNTTIDVVSIHKLNDIIIL